MKQELIDHPDNCQCSGHGHGGAGLTPAQSREWGLTEADARGLSRGEAWELAQKEKEAAEESTAGSGEPQVMRG